MSKTKDEQTIDEQANDEWLSFSFGVRLFVDSGTLEEMASE